MAVFPKFYRDISLTHCLSSPPENLLGISNMIISKFKLLILHYPSIFKLHFSIWHYWLFQTSSCLDKNAGVFLECFIFSYIRTVRKHQMLNPPQKISRNMSTIAVQAGQIHLHHYSLSWYLQLPLMDFSTSTFAVPLTST